MTREQYVVLLRGINVGGNNKVSMKDLKLSLEAAGFTDVQTYINSGNLVLKSELPTEKVNDLIEKLIKQTFGFKVFTLTLTRRQFQHIAKAIPDNWSNDSDMKCDVFFLWKEIDAPDVLGNFIIKPGIDAVKYVAGAVICSIERKNITKSGIVHIVGTPTYKKVTIRNCNTVRKLASLL